MLNQLVCVGRLVGCPEEKEGEVVIKISVGRPYKNEDGDYDSDIIPIILRNHLIEAVKDYVEEGDLIGVKARVEADGDKILIIADKLTFLSSKKDVEENEK